MKTNIKPGSDFSPHNFLYGAFFPQDETVDLRQIYLSVAALSGLVSFKSLLHTAFTVSVSCF